MFLAIGACVLVLGVSIGGVTLLARAFVASGSAATVTWPGELAPDGSWMRTALHLQTNALLADPAMSGLVWAATSSGVWTTHDDGTTWQRTGDYMRSTAVSLGVSAASDTIFAGGGDGTVYREESHLAPSVEWAAISRPLGVDRPIFSLAPSYNGHVVLAGTFGALLRGERIGGEWGWRVVARTGDSAVTSILWLAGSDRLAVAAVFGSRPAVISTRDGGHTWQPDARGLPRTLPTQALIETSKRPSQIILTTMGGGVWRWSRVGRWSDISAGLPARHAMPIIAERSSGALVLYAGTMGFGVYARQRESPWRRLGQGLAGGQYTALALAMSSWPRRTLLVGTALGVFRYDPSRKPGDSGESG
jgi:hypothetical protein